MVMDFFEARERVRTHYGHRLDIREVAKASTEPLGEKGFLTQIAGKVILTAPSSTFSGPDELPRELAARWRETASDANQYYTWLQARYVEAERANLNGAFWSTSDLQFGEPSVRFGPLNWLHNEKQVVGTLVDAALIHPATASTASAVGGSLVDGEGNPVEIAADLTGPRERPYMATVAAVWDWVHPDKSAAIHRFNDAGSLWTSMECTGKQIACVSDGTREGCGESFDYVTAMTDPKATCTHLADRSSARRIVDPTFLGAGIIVPPERPAWADASAEIMRATASLAASAHSSAIDMPDEAWFALVAQVLTSATA